MLLLAFGLINNAKKIKILSTFRNNLFLKIYCGVFCGFNLWDIFIRRVFVVMFSFNVKQYFFVDYVGVVECLLITITNEGYFCNQYQGIQYNA